MKLTTIIIVLLILLILFSSVNEGFNLTNVLPTGLSVTITKGSQTVSAKTGSGFTNDDTALEPESYYAVGTLNVTGQKAVADANALVKNTGTTCSAFPNNFYIKLPARDAVCKTSDVDLYNYSPDSFSVCTDKLKNGVLYKPGTLKTLDSDITLQDSYNGGKTCTQTLSLTKDIPCGGLDAVCKTSDADLYDVQPDSNAACNINDGGVWNKEGTLKADALITIIPKYGTGKTCTQQFSLKKNITCGPINAVCPINDNTFYTFSTVAVKGSTLLPINVTTLSPIVGSKSPLTPINVTTLSPIVGSKSPLTPINVTTLSPIVGSKPPLTPIGFSTARRGTFI
jgi:hypothetical protein